MNDSFTFLDEYSVNNDFCMFENTLDLKSNFKVSQQYVEELKSIYGERISSASYDVKLAYTDDGTPLFVDENNALVNGFWLGIPNEVYHALDAISSSQLKAFAKSRLLFKRKYVDEVNRHKTVATNHSLETGTLVHEILLEPELFKLKYYRALSAVEHPKAIDSLNELKEKAKALNLKSSGTKLELGLSIHSADPSIPIFTVMDYMHDKNNQGRIKVDSVVFDDAVRSAKTVLSNQDAEHLLTPSHGLPEVSCIFDCLFTGMKKKARFDFLRFDRIALDLKTTKTTSSRSFFRDVARYEYLLQDVFYREAYFALTGEELDNFIFVVVEYAELDNCETFEASDAEFNIHMKRLVELMIGLEQSIKNGLFTIEDKTRKQINLFR